MTTRDRILAAARTLFERDGLQGLSMRLVAREAGLSAMGIYRHFPDKGALVDALMADGFVAWEARAAALDQADPVGWLRALLDAYLAFALEDRHRFDAAFLLPARSARKYPQDFAAGRSPVVSAMIARIDQARTQGRLGDTPALTVAMTLSALAQGMVSMERAGRFSGEDEFRRSYHTATTACLAGFGATTTQEAGA